MTLSTEKQMLQRGLAKWQEFRELRNKHLVQAQRLKGGHEKITEKILENLLTIVLDWNLEDINNQMERCDIVITKRGIKFLVIETKRLGHFSSPTNVQKALSQAIEYAKKLKVNKVAISDGNKLFLTEYCLHRNLKSGWIDISLDSDQYPELLWFFSEHGIYRSPGNSRLEELLPVNDGRILHPKYLLPHSCFAYVGKGKDTKSWKLPYLNLDDTVDHKRLPSAIRCIISNYRGQTVQGIPEEAIPFVLTRLMKAARSLGKMPDQNPRTAATFIQFASILSQLNLS